MRERERVNVCVNDIGMEEYERKCVSVYFWMVDAGMCVRMKERTVYNTHSHFVFDFYRYFKEKVDEFVVRFIYLNIET